MVQQGPRELREIAAARIGEPVGVQVKPDLLPGPGDGADDLAEERSPETAREERVDEVGGLQAMSREGLQLIRQPAPVASLAPPEVGGALALARLAGWQRGYGAIRPPGARSRCRR